MKSPPLIGLFLSPRSLWQSGGLDLVVEHTKRKAELLRSVGIFGGLFPVLDMSENPDSFIYDRTIGSDPQKTSEYARGIVRTLGEVRFASTLKHFPGYGDNVDTHKEIATDKRSLRELQQSTLLPFIAGIKEGADSVMFAHIVMEELDPHYPASISKSVHDLLRNDLHFDGVMMTDALGMAGIAKFGFSEDPAVIAVKSGNDMIMSRDYRTQISLIVGQVNQGKILIEQVDASVMRILKWKQKLGLIIP